MVGPYPSDEQVEVYTRRSPMDATRRKEKRQTTWNMAKDHRGRDEKGGQDLERSQLARPRPRKLEKNFARLMLHWE